MSTFYTRESGPDGQILVDEGIPEGESLSSILDQGPLAIKIALELVAYIADVLCLAEEDGEVHGDLKPGLIRLDAHGLVHVVGYGEGRLGGRTPEGRSGALSGDVYGLGLILIAVLTTQAMGAIPRERAAHDGLIVSRLQEIDWQELDQPEWQGQVVQLVLAMLAFEPVERPQPLDIAHVMHFIAQKLPGEDLLAWANREIEPFTESEPSEESSSMDEDLPPASQLAEPAPLLAASLPPVTERSVAGPSASFNEKIQRVREEKHLSDQVPRYVPPAAPRLRPSVGETPYLPDSTVRERPPTTLVPSSGEAMSPVPTPVHATVAEPQSPSFPEPPTTNPMGSQEFVGPVSVDGGGGRVRTSIVIVMGVLLTILGGAAAGIAYVLIWDDEEENSSPVGAETESDQKRQSERSESVELPMDTGSDVLEEMNNEGEHHSAHIEMDDAGGVDLVDVDLEPFADPIRPKAVPATQVVAESKPSVVHRPTPNSASLATSEEEEALSIGKATITLRFYDERATYLCTPGDVSGEFQSQTTFDLSLQDHSYPEAVSTCLVRTIERYASQANSGLRGSFTVQGLGRKEYRCERGESSLSCRPD